MIRPPGPAGSEGPTEVPAGPGRWQDAPNRLAAAARQAVLTSAATGVMAGMAVVQVAVPGAVPLLARVPGGLAAGQWWRLVTPVLVNTLGPFQLVVNLVSLALIGAIVELHLGRVRWAVLAAGGTVGGQLSAYLQHSWGGGDSIAICGLAAGVVVALLVSRDRLPAPVSVPVIGYVAALVGWGVRGPVLAAAAAVIAFAGTLVLRRFGLERLAAAVALLCALALTAYGDLHGASLVAGALAAVALRTWRSR